MKQIRNAAIHISLAIAASACGSSATTTPVATTATTQASTQSPGSSGSSSGLTVTAASSTVAPGGTDQFTASGGNSPYYYFLQTQGNWTINPTNGLLTVDSTASSGNIEIMVMDASQNTAYATVSVGSSSGTAPNPTSSALSLSPSSSAISAGNTVTFTVSGGTAPFSYSVVSGAGTLSVSGSPSDSTSTTYTSSSSESGVIEVEVVDANSNVATAQVSVSDAVVTVTQYSNAFNLFTDDMLGVTLYNPSNATNPELIFFGTGSKPDEASMLAHTAYTTCGSDQFGNSVSPCTIGVPLTNFSNSNPGTTTYEGTVTFVGRSGSGSYLYCIDPNTSLSQAFILPQSMSGSATNEFMLLNMAYNDSQAGRKLLNGVLTDDYFTEVDTNGGAGWVYVYINGAYTNHTSCAAYGTNFVEAF